MVSRGLREEVLLSGVAPRLRGRRDHRVPRRVGGGQEHRRGGRRARDSRGRRLPRSGGRTRAKATMAHHHRQSPPQADGQADHPTGCHGRLLRRRRAPAEHGVLQLRHSPAASGARRAGGLPHRRAGRAQAQRRVGGLLRRRRRSPADRGPSGHRRGEPGRPDRRGRRVPGGDHAGVRRPEPHGEPQRRRGHRHARRRPGGLPRRPLRLVVRRLRARRAVPARRRAHARRGRGRCGEDRRSAAAGADRRPAAV
ncbi:hypothetical protein A3Q40_03984 [Rhodococcus sp. PBTS 1]|nr:hypothetical protein A3Q40_03984 [Rhodococcus sp. PBTS 1]